MYRPRVRWMIRADLPTVIAISNLSFRNDAWQEANFLHHMKQRNCIGMVVENRPGEQWESDSRDIVLGYMVYELLSDRFNLIQLAVHPEHRRCGFGRTMIEKMISKLSYDRRNQIFYTLNDDDYLGHALLRAMGFKATGLERNKKGKDKFLMRYMVRGQQKFRRNSL